MIKSGRLRTTVLGFLGAVIAFAIAIWVIGPHEIYDALTMSQPIVLIAIVGVAGCWLTAWGLSLRTVLDALDAPVPISTAVLVFASATFANNITPFGQAGGEPVSALLISRASNREYETGLAAIASVDALNFVPSIGLALVGFGYFATTLTFGTDLTFAAAAICLFAAVLVVVAVFAWRYRYRIERGVVATFGPLIQRTARVLPKITPPEPEVVENRVTEFFTAIERVATSPRKLALALVFSTVGWMALAVSLWLSLYALGYTVPFAVVLVAVPAGAMASITPLPGGLGGVAAVLGALVTGTTGGISIATVTAAILIHRGATYVLPTMVGGGVAAVLAAR